MVDRGTDLDRVRRYSLAGELTNVVGREETCSLSDGGRFTKGDVFVLDSDKHVHRFSRRPPTTTIDVEWF